MQHLKRNTLLCSINSLNLNIQLMLMHNLYHHFKIIYFQIFRPTKMNAESSEVGHIANFGQGQIGFKGFFHYYLSGTAPSHYRRLLIIMCQADKIGFLIHTIPHPLAMNKPSPTPPLICNPSECPLKIPAILKCLHH